jgi:hypothetical protein
MGTYYYEKVLKDKSLSKDAAKNYLTAGIQAEDKALALNNDYFEAVTYKNLLIRLEANQEKDRAVQKRLLDEADQLRDRALAIQKQQGSAATLSGGKKD